MCTNHDRIFRSTRTTEIRTPSCFQCNEHDAQLGPQGHDHHQAVVHILVALPGYGCCCFKFGMHLGVGSWGASLVPRPFILSATFLPAIRSLHSFSRGMREGSQEVRVRTCPSWHRSASIRMTLGGPHNVMGGVGVLGP